MRLFIIGGFIALAACNNGGNCDNCDTNTGDDTNACEGCGDDTGTPAEMSYVEVQVFVPTQDDIVSCHADLTGPPDYSFDTVAENGDPVVMSVQTGTYSVEVGDADHLTSYGSPIHTAADGAMSIAPADTQAKVEAATESAPQIVAIDNIPYFRGTFSCSHDEYTYSPDTSDHKSGTGRHLGDWTVNVEVRADGGIEALDDASEFGVLPADSFFLVTPGNEITAEIIGNHNITIGFSQINIDSFMVSVIDTDLGVVEDLTCQQ